MTQTGNKGQTIIGPTGPTFEWTNLKEQMKGIKTPTILRLILRVLILVVGLCVVLCIGEQAGGFILGITSAYLLFGILMGAVTSVERFPFIIIVGFALTILAFVDYWPDMLVWQRVETQLHYRLQWTIENRWFAWLSYDTGLIPVTSTVAWVRAIMIIIVPFMVFDPFRIADWAFGMETLWTNARNLRFRAADPGSIPGTQDFGVTGGSTQSETEGQEQKPGIIPAPIVEGS